MNFAAVGSSRNLGSGSSASGDVTGAAPGTRRGASGWLPVDDPLKNVRNMPRLMSDRGGRQRPAAAAGGQLQLERLDVTPLDAGDAPAGRIVQAEVVGEQAQRDRCGVDGSGARRDGQLIQVGDHRAGRPGELEDPGHFGAAGLKRKMPLYPNVIVPLQIDLTIGGPGSNRREINGSGVWYKDRVKIVNEWSAPIGCVVGRRGRGWRRVGRWRRWMVGGSAAGGRLGNGADLVLVCRRDSVRGSRSGRRLGRRSSASEQACWSVEDLDYS